MPPKRGEGRFELDKFVAFVKANGDEHRTILIKGDPESAIKKLLRIPAGAEESSQVGR